ncbi:hypothetical protein CPB83DRAFT_900825 [Crepidotus variabilis]|uniref:Uncharacterized protein n=1 Tax=Crepidotus variabilis TaxID=179855 RepID=A0A9P6BC52_9AGAR|nr:hypothetical protein CPB83DRAFT_900825 [Crepidotus variabilis]
MFPRCKKARTPGTTKIPKDDRVTRSKQPEVTIWYGPDADDDDPAGPAPPHNPYEGDDFDYHDDGNQNHPPNPPRTPTPPPSVVPVTDQAMTSVISGPSVIAISHRSER